jgi:hypothetical protein
MPDIGDEIAKSKEGGGSRGSAGAGSNDAISRWERLIDEWQEAAEDVRCTTPPINDLPIRPSDDG